MIEIKANGFIYSGFEKVSVTKSMQSICDTFAFEAFNGDQIDINGNDFIQIYDNGELFFSGYVDNYNIGIGDTKKPLSCSGRSRACDLIDCNIEEIRQFNSQNPIQIISKLIKPFGLKVSTNLSLDIIPFFDTKVGETYFNAINRLCKQYNILPISKPDGNIELIKNNNTKEIDTVKDQDLKSLDFNQDFTNRFSSYVYKKESVVKDITDGKLKDSEINRYRPFVGVNTEDKTNTDLAKWKKNNDISKSINLSCTVRNWDYAINKLLKFDTEIVKNTFLIKDITYTLDDNGKISKLNLVGKGLFNV